MVSQSFAFTIQIQNTENHLKTLIKAWLYIYLAVIVGGFNACIKEFVYKRLVKNILSKCSVIDLILTNNPPSFQNSCFHRISEEW